MSKSALQASLPKPPAVTSSGGIKLSAASLQGNLVIDPISVNFGGVLVGSVSDGLTVTLSNDGTASLDVTALSAATAVFARSGGTCSANLPITIAASDSCTLGYTFSPNSPGFAEQTLTLTADAPGSGSIELLGSGIQGNLAIDPVSIDFGNVLVGNVSGESTVQLSNHGTASLDVTSLTTPNGAFARSGGTCSDTLPITLAASSFCVLRYTFSPSVAGLATQTLTVTADAPGSASVELSGTGVLGNLVINPGVIEFGTLTVGEINALGVVTLGNDGEAEVTVTSLTVATEPFARTTDGSCGNQLPFTIAQGASCTLSYSYAPSEAGTAQQTLVLDSTGTGDTGFGLSGKAIPGESEIFFDGFEPINSPTQLRAE